MIFVFVIIGLCGIVSADVSEIIKPSREYLPPSREYLPPALTKQLVLSTSGPTVTTSFLEDVQSPSTTSSITAQNIFVQNTVAPDIISTVVPTTSKRLNSENEIISTPATTVTDRVSISREYLPPAPVSSAIPKLKEISVQNEILPPIPSIATPNGITINSNADQDDLEILTNIIAQPIFSTVIVPQTSTIIPTDLTPTTIASQPSVVTFISETTPVSQPTQPTSVPEYIQNTSVFPIQERDPLIRINASELSEANEQISELPTALTDASTPETILSEDGYHYSIPLISFGAVNKK